MGLTAEWDFISEYRSKIRTEMNYIFSTNYKVLSFIENISNENLPYFGSDLAKVALLLLFFIKLFRLFYKLLK